MPTDHEARARELLHQTSSPVLNWDAMVVRIADALQAADRAGYERGFQDGRGRGKGKLSPEAMAARKPPPPADRVGALQGSVHRDRGRSRAAKSGGRRG